MSARETARITGIRLDAASIVRWNREVEHERQVAIFDLLESNSFELVNGFAGPYQVELALREAGDRGAAISAMAVVSHTAKARLSQRV